MRSADSKIDAAFGTSATFFALGQLGASYEGQGHGSETTTADLNLTIDPAHLHAPDHLVIGLYGGAGKGAGVGSVTLDISAGGNDLIDQTFTSAAAATSFLTDHPLDLGALSSIAGGGAFALDISLTEILTKSGSGEAAKVLIGDSHA